MDVFTRRKKLQCISVYSVFTWKEKSQGISVDSKNDGNNWTTKKVNWKQTERQTDLLCEYLQRNTDLNYTLMAKSNLHLVGVKLQDMKKIPKALFFLMV